jgi:hypothetical protein
MTDFAERTLGPEAVRYIRWRLETGKTFAHHLLDALDLDRGSVITYLTIDVSDEDAVKFREGALPLPDPSTFRRFTDAKGRTTTMVPKPNTDPWLVTLIQSFLKSAPDRVCIVEDFLPLATDPFWSKAASERECATFVGDEVYYVLMSGDAEERLTKVVRRASSAWPGSLAAMTSMKQAQPVPREARTVDPDQWLGFAEQTERLAVQAYDGESYLVWTKPS